MRHVNTLLVAALAAVALSGCKERIEMDKVDSSAYVNVGLSAPIVTIKTPLIEILGVQDTTGQGEMFQWLYVKDDTQYAKDAQLKDVADGTLYFRDTFDITRDFHPIVLSSFINPVQKQLNVYEQVYNALPASVRLGMQMAGITEVTLPAGSSFKLSFPMTVKLDSLNGPDYVNRVDSMIISQAHFNSLIATNFGLSDADIVSLNLKCPSEFTRNGKPMSDVAIETHLDSGDTTKIQIDDFEISMLSAGANVTNRRQHMKDSLVFTLEFDVRTSKPMTITKQSDIDYTFYVELLTYKALFGYFDPSKAMEANDTMRLADEWPAWNDIKRLKMRFVYPTIRLLADHQIGTEEGYPLYVNLNHIGVAQTDENGNQIGELTTAKFGVNGDEESTEWLLYDVKKKDISRVDPLTDPLDKWSHNEFIVGYTGYEEGTHVGDVEKMFNVKPDVIGFKYEITIGPKNNPAIHSQCRVTNETRIFLRAVTVVPFVCEEGSEVEYNDTLAVDFSTLSLDSITETAQWLDSVVDGTIYLYLYADNYIPFDISAVYSFYDEAWNEVKLPLVTDNEGKAASYTMTVPAPKKFDNRNMATEAGKNTIILRISNEDFDKFRSIRHILYNVSLDNNPQRVTLWTGSSLDIKIGVAASVEAILNMNKLMNQNEK